MALGDGQTEGDDGQSQRCFERRAVPKISLSAFRTQRWTVKALGLNLDQSSIFSYFCVVIAIVICIFIVLQHGSSSECHNGQGGANIIEVSRLAHSAHFQPAKELEAEVYSGSFVPVHSNILQGQHQSASASR